jgi:glycolate oxidase FAD binding subunit
MLPITPASAQELADLLKDAAGTSRSISVAGNGSKRLMGGPCRADDVAISTVRLNRVLQYEPNDLTVSIEAGTRWADLQNLLRGHHQMIALDPPFSGQATVGGVIASNSNGPLRKLFGTARDLVIGMQFAMLDGKLVRTGGMVVKNVAGLDIGKLMIGSFGTLAVITSVNFRLHTLPEETNTFLFCFSELDAAIQKRDALLKSVLRPLTLDLLNPPASARLGRRGYLLAIRASGSRRVLSRYQQDLAGSDRLTGANDDSVWTQIREFPADFLRRQPGGIVVRLSTPLSELGKLFRLVSSPCISRAGSGVNYIYLSAAQQIAPLWKQAGERSWAGVIEFAPDEVRSMRQLWLPTNAHTDGGFDMMKSIKQMFDPSSLLNRSRLYGRI